MVPDRTACRHMRATHGGCICPDDDTLSRLCYTLSIPERKPKTGETMKHTFLMILLTAALLLAAGCAQKDNTNETTTDATEPQTALETVADVGEQEIFLPLDDEDMTVSAAPTTAKQSAEPSAQSATTAKADKETQNTTTTATKPAAEQNAATTTTTKPAAEQKPAATTTGISNGTPKMTDAPATTANGTPKTTSVPSTSANGTPITTSAPATTANGTPKTTSALTTTANGTPTTTSAATLPTADAEKGSYDLPAIPLR